MKEKIKILNPFYEDEVVVINPLFKNQFDFLSKINDIQTLSKEKNEKYFESLNPLYLYDVNYLFPKGINSDYLVKLFINLNKIE
jgi:hypothetical protein